MQSATVHFITVFMAFFAIMNPIANSTLFVSLADGLDAVERRRVALRAVIVAFCIVAVFAVGGRVIFSAFGVTLPAFRIAGGLLIGLIGFHMLQGQHSPLHVPSQEDGERSADSALDLAFIPLGMPILAGPGTIATAMNFAAESTLMEITRVLVAFAAMCALTFVAFMAGQWFVQVMGQNAIKVVSRLMGLLLAVVGVQMLIEGVRGAIA